MQQSLVCHMYLITVHPFLPLYSTDFMIAASCTVRTSNCFFFHFEVLYVMIFKFFISIYYLIIILIHKAKKESCELISNFFLKQPNPCLCKLHRFERPYSSNCSLKTTNILNKLQPGIQYSNVMISICPLAEKTSDCY